MFDLAYIRFPILDKLSFSRQNSNHVNDRPILEIKQRKLGGGIRGRINISSVLCFVL